MNNEQNTPLRDGYTEVYVWYFMSLPDETPAMQAKFEEDFKGFRSARVQYLETITGVVQPYKYLLMAAHQDDLELMEFACGVGDIVRLRDLVAQHIEWFDDQYLFPRRVLEYVQC